MVVIRRIARKQRRNALAVNALLCLRQAICASHPNVGARWGSALIAVALESRGRARAPRAHALYHQASPSAPRALGAAARLN